MPGIETIRLSHGSGSGMAQVLDEVIFPLLGSTDARVHEDAALLGPQDGRLAFTTDSFVVQPLMFPGGDIGKLAACGTINDLAVMGATPKYLSVSLILEDGLEVTILRRILGSLRRVCDECGVAICCGDTKVVENGKGDGVYITTSGIGVVPPHRNISVANAREGDAVLVSGPIGLHGTAVMAQRQGLGFASDAVSDCAPLGGIIESLLAAVPLVRVLRDATRGGCAAVLNEIAVSSEVTIRVDKRAVPIPPVVEGACSYLGLDPLQVANEGRFVAVVSSGDVEASLNALHSHPLGAGAALIGTVEKKGRFAVLLETEVGGVRPLEVPPGELLPRIC